MHILDNHANIGGVFVNIWKMVCVVMIGLIGGPAFAADVAEFYKGKTVNLIVGYGPGGGYDLYARLLARHMAHRIPGNPTITVQNMPGAGSMRAANHLFIGAPKDGTAFGIFDRNMPLMAFIGGSSNVQFDPLKFVWIGSLSDSSDDAFVLWARKSAQAKSIDDLRRPGGPALTVGVATAGATDNDVGVILRDISGLRLNLVQGYPDSNAVGLAVESGEVDAQLIGHVTSKIMRPAWTAPGSPMQILVQFGRPDRHPELANVPTARELAADDRARQLIDLAQFPYQIARPFVAPPGTPPDRAEALQEAFRQTVKDADFLDEARKLNLEISPVDGIAATRLIGEMGRSPLDVRQRLREALYGAAKP